MLEKYFLEITLDALKHKHFHVERFAKTANSLPLTSIACSPKRVCTNSKFSPVF